MEILHIIEDCPASAANRFVRVHWGTDTVVSKQGNACLVMLMDREIRYWLGEKATSKIAAAGNKVMCEAYSGQPHLSAIPDCGKFLETCSAQQRAEACDVLRSRSAPSMGAWNRRECQWAFAWGWRGGI